MKYSISSAVGSDRSVLPHGLGGTRVLGDPGKWLGRQHAAAGSLEIADVHLQSPPSGYLDAASEATGNCSVSFWI